MHRGEVMRKLSLILILLLSCIIIFLPACNSNPPTSSIYGVKAWVEEPPMTINQNKTYTAKMKVSIDGEIQGDIIIELFPKEAPHAVNNFVFLSKQGFYNGLSFHRIIKDFAVQGGCPLGTGTGGPGYNFVDDRPIVRDYLPGTLAMANSGANTNGSQFFFALSNLSNPNNKYQLTKDYVIFGMVTSGFDIVQAMGNVSTTIGQDFQMSRPLVDVRIITVVITEK